MKRYQIPQLPL